MRTRRFFVVDTSFPADHWRYVVSDFKTKRTAMQLAKDKNQREGKNRFGVKSPNDHVTIPMAVGV